jgi:hypothetical protein
MKSGEIPVKDMTSYEKALVAAKGVTSKVKIKADGKVFVGSKEYKGKEPASKWGRRGKNR